MDASVLGISLQKRENSGPVYIKERECYFTKRNVASHSVHHNENAECMSRRKENSHLIYRLKKNIIENISSTGVEMTKGNLTY